MFIQIIYICTLTITMMSLLFTTCSDPGVVPRPLTYADVQSEIEQCSGNNSLLGSKKKNKVNAIDEENDLEASLTQDTSNNGLLEELKGKSVSSINGNKKSRRPTGHNSNQNIQQYFSKFVSIVAGEQIEVKRCRTCKILRPPRSFHCSDCQACIEVQYLT